jgi:transcriptional regulator with XRE-family HTH domain
VTSANQLPAECLPVLRALVRPLRYQRSQLGWSQEQLAARVGCHRSRVSRALSGDELPPRDLIGRIAVALGSDIDRAMRRWAQADQLRRNSLRPSPGMTADATSLGGCLPAELRTYPEFLQGLRDLMRERGVSERELARLNRNMRRSSVGAVLRGERSMSLSTLDAILRACGVSDQARQAWSGAWWRLGQPHQEEAHRRRREGYRSMLVRDIS